MAEIKRWLVLHHDDPDGWVSAAIVGAYALGSLDAYRRGTPTFREVNYGVKVEDLDLEGYDEIWMVDFSMPLEAMEKIQAATKRFTWIDHHASAIRNVVDAGFKAHAGAQEEGRAGCQLTWGYCFREVPEPRVVSRIGGFDIGNFSRPNLRMMFGMSGRGDSLHPSRVDVWARLFLGLELADELDKEGGVILRFKETEWARLGPHIQTIKWEGHTWAVLNSRELGSLQIEPHMKAEWDGSLVYSRGANGWRIGLRGFKDGVDCSKIAEKHGGGGHPLASGISGAKRLPFEKKISALEESRRNSLASKLTEG